MICAPAVAPPRGGGGGGGGGVGSAMADAFSRLGGGCCQGPTATLPAVGKALGCGAPPPLGSLAAAQPDNCAICLGGLSRPVELSCSHSFCYVCLANAAAVGANYSCPLCRTVWPAAVPSCSITPSSSSSSPCYHPPNRKSTPPFLVITCAGAHPGPRDAPQTPGQVPCWLPCLASRPVAWCPG